MKPLSRWVFNGIAALCLILCVGTAFLWISSHFRQDDFVAAWIKEKDAKMAADSLFFHSTRGSVGVFFWRRDIPPEQIQFWRDSWKQSWHCAFRSFKPIEHLIYNTPPLGFNFMGFDIGGKNTPAGALWAVDAPDWSLVIIFGALGICRVAPELKRRIRVKSGRCAVCGYDLRATPDRCPECGTVPPKPTPPPK
jgi:hypothetical protein